MIILLRIILFGLCLFYLSQQSLASSCTYNTYSWNTTIREAVDHKTVNKPYDELIPAEVDAFTGCTVCEEDQRTVSIPPIQPFKICHIIAPGVEEILQSLVDRGEPIFSITGYRVGNTRGVVDEKGNRTHFSNHSFGIAFDINADLNGLYDNCIAFSESCRLIKGGAWRPEQRGGLSIDSPLVRAFQSMGFKWGGQILGQQKDFMHFSPTGY